MCQTEFKLMLRFKTVPCVWGAALAATLVSGLMPTAAAQTEDFSRRLFDAQKLRARDHFAEARTAYQALLRDVRKDSSQYRLAAIVQDNLALDEQDSGDYASAETIFNHGLATMHATAPDDPIRVDLETHLAELYIAEVRSEDAEPLLRQVVAALRRSSMPAPMALSIADEDLAVVCITRHKLDEPEALLRQSQALVEKVFGPDNPRMTASLLTYAGLLTAEHRYAEAVAPAERAWQILHTGSTPIPKPYLASALSVMGAIYYHAGRQEEAAEWARQSVELAEESLGPQHPRLGLYLANYATILKQSGRKNEAKAVQKKADEVMDRHPAPGSGGYTVNVAALR
jgi:tetratricopeptide (TPR) repeat protein